MPPSRRTKRVFILALLGLSVVVSGLKAQSNPTVTDSSRMPRLINADDDGFVIIGHRGASSYFPENTMPSFKGAVERGAEMLELDVQLSKDGVPVVFHDAKLQRTTNGEGALSHRTLGEIKQLDAGSWFAKRFTGTRIPTLEEVLEFAKDRIALNIEIKTEAVANTVEGGVEEKCLELVKQYGMEEHVLFSSFDYRAIEHLRQLDPDIPIALLYNPIMAGGKKPSELIAEFKADAFNCSKRELDGSWIRDLKANNIPVFVYTVNQRRTMKLLVKKEIAGIFTNKPDVLKKVVANVLKKDSDDKVE